MPAKKKCGDQKISGGRKECEADGNQRMRRVGGKEHDICRSSMDLGRSEMCKYGEVVCKQSSVQQRASKSTATLSCNPALIHFNLLHLACN